MESIPHGYVCYRYIACIMAKSYAMDSGCIYYQRVFRDGSLIPKLVLTGIRTGLVRFLCYRKRLGKKG